MKLYLSLVEGHIGRDMAVCVQAASSLDVAVAVSHGSCAYMSARALPVTKWTLGQCLGLFQLPCCLVRQACPADLSAVLARLILDSSFLPHTFLSHVVSHRPVTVTSQLSWRASRPSWSGMS
jgi:hypothetical protein